MSALPGAAAAIGYGFLASLWQLHRSPWALVPAALAAAMLAARWYLHPRDREPEVTRLPGDTQPSQVIDDALPEFFERGPVLSDSVRDAIEQMVRDWHEQRGGTDG